MKSELAQSSNKEKRRQKYAVGLNVVDRTPKLCVTDVGARRGGDPIGFAQRLVAIQNNVLLTPLSPLDEVYLPIDLIALSFAITFIDRRPKSTTQGAVMEYVAANNTFKNLVSNYPGLTADLVAYHVSRLVTPATKSIQQPIIQQVRLHEVDRESSRLDWEANKRSITHAKSWIANLVNNPRITAAETEAIKNHPSGSNTADEDIFVCGKLLFKLITLASDKDKFHEFARECNTRQSVKVQVAGFAKLLPGEELESSDILTAIRLTLKKDYQTTWATATTEKINLSNTKSLLLDIKPLHGFTTECKCILWLMSCLCLFGLFQDEYPSIISSAAVTMPKDDHFRTKGDWPIRLMTKFWEIIWSDTNQIYTKVVGESSQTFMSIARSEFMSKVSRLVKYTKNKATLVSYAHMEETERECTRLLLRDAAGWLWTCCHVAKNLIDSENIKVLEQLQEMLPPDSSFCELWLAFPFRDMDEEVCQRYGSKLQFELNNDGAVDPTTFWTTLIEKASNEQSNIWQWLYQNDKQNSEHLWRGQTRGPVTKSIEEKLSLCFGGCKTVELTTAQNSPEMQRLRNMMMVVYHTNRLRSLKLQKNNIPDNLPTISDRQGIINKGEIVMDTSNMPQDHRMRVGIDQKNLAYVEPAIWRTEFNQNAYLADQNKPLKNTNNVQMIYQVGTDWNCKSMIRTIRFKDYFIKANLREFLINYMLEHRKNSLKLAVEVIGHLFKCYVVQTEKWLWTRHDWSDKQEFIIYLMGEISGSTEVTLADLCTGVVLSPEGRMMEQDLVSDLQANMPSWIRYRMSSKLQEPYSQGDLYQTNAAYYDEVRRNNKKVEKEIKIVTSELVQQIFRKKEEERLIEEIQNKTIYQTVIEAGRDIEEDQAAPFGMILEGWNDEYSTTSNITATTKQSKASNIGKRPRSTSAADGKQNAKGKSNKKSSSRSRSREKGEQVLGEVNEVDEDSEFDFNPDADKSITKYNQQVKEEKLAYEQNRPTQNAEYNHLSAQFSRAKENKKTAALLSMIEATRVINKAAEVPAQPANPFNVPDVQREAMDGDKPNEKPEEGKEEQ